MLEGLSPIGSTAKGMAKVPQECQNCERFRSLALQASAFYYTLLFELESAYINHEDGRAFQLRQRIDEALMVRNAAIDDLSLHEQNHLRIKSVGA